MTMNRVLRKQELSFTTEHFIAQKEINYHSYKEYDEFNLWESLSFPYTYQVILQGLWGFLCLNLRLQFSVTLVPIQQL